ncbi:MAG TPA: hypothetical protein VHO50_07480 [Bacteroidales bacterium]|nr:hypothetical protein [Bacteroidales bacterium]
MSNKKKSEKSEYPSLADIRETLSQVDEKRKDASLSKEEREILELSAVALRDAERLAISRLQQVVVKEMEASTAAINKLAKQIRSKVTRMNKVPGAINKIEAVIKIAVAILSAVGKWW